MRVQRLAEVEATEYARLMRRSAADVQRVLPQVQAIMEAVRERGDVAVREFTACFDGAQRCGRSGSAAAGRARAHPKSATRS